MSAELQAFTRHARRMAAGRAFTLPSGEAYVATEEERALWTRLADECDAVAPLLLDPAEDLDRAPSADDVPLV